MAFTGFGLAASGFARDHIGMPPGHRGRYRSPGRVGAGSTTETKSEAGNVSSSMHPLAFPSLLHRQHQVEPRVQHIFRAGDLHDEFGVEEIVRAVGLLVGKIELGG